MHSPIFQYPCADCSQNIFLPIHRNHYRRDIRELFKLAALFDAATYHWLANMHDILDQEVFAEAEENYPNEYVFNSKFLTK